MKHFSVLPGAIIGAVLGCFGCGSTDGEPAPAKPPASSAGATQTSGGAADSATGGATEASSGGAPGSADPSDLLQVVQAADYRAWARAPGYAARQASQGPHGGSVDIYINDTLTLALQTPGLTAWPEGSLIVKDGFRDEQQQLTAIMQKRADGWVWAEYYASGEVYSGPVSVCTGCHQIGSDFVRAFALP